jgi:hypothetical protein
MEAYREKMELNPEEMKSVAMHEVVPKEDAAVETFATMKRRYGDWNLAVRHRGQGQRKEKAVPRIQKGQTFGMRCRAKLVGINGIMDRHLKEQLCLGSKRISRGIFRKALVLEFAKQTLGTSIRLRKMSARTLWRRGRPPLKRKNRLHTE